MNERQIKFLDKLLKILVDETIVEEGTFYEINIIVPFTFLRYNRPRYFDKYDFCSYCKEQYGLTREECDYIYPDYILEINDILISEWGVRDPLYH